MSGIAHRLFIAAPGALARARLHVSRPPAAALAPLRASSSGSGPQITSELMDRMRSKIKDALEAQVVDVQDMQGDGRHVEISVVASAFEGKGAVARQRMVYKAIWSEISEGPVHAVDALVTQTPEEAGL